MTSRVWTNPGAVWLAYNKALVNLDAVVAREKKQPWPNRYFLQDAFSAVVERAREMADWALQTRAIPKGEAKALELATRLVTIIRVPSNIISWYDTNRQKLDFLLQTMTWGEKSSGSAGSLDLATVGPFKVHNTIGAKEKQFKDLQALVKSAVRVITPVMDFKKVLYGDVFIVGQLRQARTLAWYSPSQDEVYLRNLARKGIDDLESLVHELGHRYWFKFATPNQKRNISLLYMDLGISARNVRVPDLKPGDVLPVPVRGLEPPLVITSITPRSYVITPRKLPVGVLPGATATVSIDAVQGLMKQKAVTGKLFPTAYSMKNDVEFFAECFAFYVLGKLPKDLVPQFEKAMK